ncbi:putative cell wall binding protein [Lachnospiraceae bacterium JC7]|nr:putative cell wall binding protein [Lachnospiraceae bacterium JC7]
MRFDNRNTYRSKLILNARIAGMILMAFMCFTAVIKSGTVAVYAASSEGKDYSFSSLQWDTEDDVMMAYWDQSEDDQRYKLQLYKDSVSVENKVGNTVTVTNKDYYDFTKLVVSEGVGNYIFTVTGLKENDTQVSNVAYIDIGKLHKIEDKYMGEHPKTVFGKYSIEKMDLIQRVDPVTAAAYARTMPGYNTAEASTMASLPSLNNGWLKLKDGDWYHFTNGVMDTGWFTDPATGDRYYLNPDGTMKTGYLYLDGQNYYFEASGKLSQAAKS